MSLPPTLTCALPDLELLLVDKGQVILGEDDSKTPLNIDPFYMCKYQVTQALYKALMDGENPSHFKGDKRPVEKVSWLEAREFTTILNDRKELIKELASQLPQTDPAKIKFRLPSEAEWEYAAKGGNYTQNYLYSGSDDLKQVGWFRENSGHETKPVGLLWPNELGLHDMSGNVWEWCADDYHSLEDIGRPIDGKAWGAELADADRASYRVIRGGSYFSGPIICRPSSRINRASGYRRRIIGFRLVMSVQSAGG